MRTPYYKAIKNFVHNEVGLSKEEFKQVMIEAVKVEAKAFVNRQMQGTSSSFIQEEFKKEVAKEVGRMLGGSSYNGASRTLLENMAKELVRGMQVIPRQL